MFASDDASMAVDVVHAYFRWAAQVSTGLGSLYRARHGSWAELAVPAVF